MSRDNRDYKNKFTDQQILEIETKILPILKSYDMTYKMTDSESLFLGKPDVYIYLLSGKVTIIVTADCYKRLAGKNFLTITPYTKEYIEDNKICVTPDHKLQMELNADPQKRTSSSFADNRSYYAFLAHLDYDGKERFFLFYADYIKKRYSPGGGGGSIWNNSNVTRQLAMYEKTIARIIFSKYYNILPRDITSLVDQYDAKDDDEEDIANVPEPDILKVEAFNVYQDCGKQVKTDKEILEYTENRLKGAKTLGELKEIGEMLKAVWGVYSQDIKDQLTEKFKEIWLDIKSRGVK